VDGDDEADDDGDCAVTAIINPKNTIFFIYEIPKFISNIGRDRSIQFDSRISRNNISTKYYWGRNNI